MVVILCVFVSRVLSLDPNIFQPLRVYHVCLSGSFESGVATEMT